MPGKFEVYEDRAGKVRFRLVDADGVVVARGEAHESRNAAHATCEAVQVAAASAEIVET